MEVVDNMHNASKDFTFDNLLPDVVLEFNLDTFQVGDGFLCRFQVLLDLPLGLLDVSPDLLFTLQVVFELNKIINCIMNLLYKRYTYKDYIFGGLREVYPLHSRTQKVFHEHLLYVEFFFEMIFPPILLVKICL